MITKIKTHLFILFKEFFVVFNSYIEEKYQNNRKKAKKDLEENNSHEVIQEVRKGEEE